MNSIGSYLVHLLAFSGCLLVLSAAAQGGENCKKYCESFGMIYIPGPETASEYSQGKGMVGYRTNSSGDIPSDFGPSSFRSWPIGLPLCNQTDDQGMGTGSGAPGDWLDTMTTRTCIYNEV